VVASVPLFIIGVASCGSAREADSSREPASTAEEVSFSGNGFEAQEIATALLARGAPESSPRLADALARFAASSDPDPEAEEAKELAEALAVTGLTCEVTFRTATPGATIQFRLIARDAVETAGFPTNDAVERIPIGLYWVWAERSTVTRVSARKRYRVVETSKTIQIPEAD